MAPVEHEAPTSSWKKRLNFITLHYAYIIAMTFLGSIVLYPKKNMAYIDALFFGSGASTQSGLNTVDVNTIFTYQQIIIYLIPMVTTPIFVNTIVVMVRLYWFEKRLQHVVALSRHPSKAATMSRSRTAENQNSDSHAERGIRGRDIRVLHENRENGDTHTPPIAGPDGVMNMHQSVSPHTISPNTSRPPSVEPPTVAGGNGTKTSQESSDTEVATPRGPNIHFDLATIKSRENRSDMDTHIAFVENQRMASNGRALYIPGPREAENGQRPTEVDDDNPLQQTTTKDDGNARTGHVPTRSFSMGAATTNASMNLRNRKFPTMDRILPTATTALTSAFSVGTAPQKAFRPFSRATTVEPPEMPYLSYKPTLGRNSNFLDLSDEERDELGGIEYRSLKLLVKILLGYYLIFHVFGVICLLPWILNKPEYREKLANFGVGPTWWAFFSAQTAFNDVGFTLTPDSMISFQTAVWPLIAMTFLIVIGNTGFPCLLRFIIWALFKLVPDTSSTKECLNFLLDHPRRCFTLLFPRRETWVLFWVLIILNAADVILFIVLDLNDVDVQKIAVGYRIIDALFQAASTRTAGLAVVNIADLHPAVQVSYMIMMYISIFPIAISVRRTNVYEEQALGVYSEPDDDNVGDSPASYIGMHLRKQLSFDIWYIFVGLFIICIAEGSHIESREDYTFTIFSILFEVVSAYGTVGLSLGHPSVNTSFSGKFSVVSKLVIIATQIRGRHRAMPYELDRAILLPKEQRDTDMASLRRRASSLSIQRPSMGAQQQQGGAGAGMGGMQRVQSQAVVD
ncbi:hypothetical protein EX30DRAFT_333334 [Ascodesmis nigricans]|uniref:Potassium transport protein n=1 Tax=Ascodesmis nigricans TaxID=341454 RepID=A0A4S2MQH6_9PEZI|nr:hypothetical protein EX30DRAFT_333334 [Ascodesmis nigricans]